MHTTGLHKPTCTSQVPAKKNLDGMHGGGSGAFKYKESRDLTRIICRNRESQALSELLRILQIEHAETKLQATEVLRSTHVGK